MTNWKNVMEKLGEEFHTKGTFQGAVLKVFSYT